MRNGKGIRVARRQENNIIYFLPTKIVVSRAEAAIFYAINDKK